MSRILVTDTTATSRSSGTSSRFALTRGNSLFLGYSASGEKLMLTPTQRSGHLHCTGITGRGKTSYLEFLIRQDIAKWPYSRSGLILIDRDGALYDSIVRWVAANPMFHRYPIILADLRSDDHLVSFDVLRQREGVPPATVSANLTDAMAHVMRDSSGAATPQFARIAGAVFHALYEAGLGIDVAHHAFDPKRKDFRETLARSTSNDMVRQTLLELDVRKASDHAEHVSSTLNRLWQLLSDPRMRAILGSSTASLDLGKALDDGAIVLICTSCEKAKTSERGADMFATLILSDLWMSARQRGKKKSHRPFYGYFDEFQNYVTPTITQSLDMARGYSLHLTLAHQYPAQLLNEGDIGTALYRSVMQNTANTIAFASVSEEDLRPLAHKLFMGAMNPYSVKHTISSPQTVQYIDEPVTSRAEGYVRSKGTNESRQSSRALAIGNSTGSSHTHTTQQGRGSTTTVSETFDPEGNVVSRQTSTQSAPDDWTTSDADSEQETVSETNTETTGMSTGSSANVGHSLSRTFATRLRPVIQWGTTSVEYKSIDEQYFLAMQAIFSLPKRHAILRRDGELLPHGIRTPDVEPPFVNASLLRRFFAKAFARLPCIMPPSETHETKHTREAAAAEDDAEVDLSQSSRTLRLPLDGGK